MTTLGDFANITDKEISRFPRKIAYTGPRGNCWVGDRKIRRARILENSQIERVLAHIVRTSNAPESDEVKLKLSIYTGLRAAEISGLTWDAVVDADGAIAAHIFIGGHISKGGRHRVVPMHPQVKSALLRLRAAYPDIPFLAFSARWGVRHQSPAAVKNWFSRLYQAVGLEGCSSHSGRRTFITRMARSANLHGGSLRDVQLLAGHAALETTSAYIEPTADLAGLVASI